MTSAILKVGTVILNLIYCFFKLMPTRNKVTMISRQDDVPSDEFEMIKAEIEGRGDGTEVVMLCHTLKGKERSSLMERIKYGLHMFTQMRHIATSKVIILDTYCMAVSLLRHKKSLKVIQMWHSMGTMKKFGYMVLDTEEGVSSKLARTMRMHDKYDYIFASEDAYKPHLAEGFNTDISKIITMPLPRLDKLINDKEYEAATRKRIYEKYPQLKEKPVILYSPTFRMNENEFEQAVKELMAKVDTDKFNLVIALHPLSKTKKRLKASNKVIIPEGFNSFEMIFVADCMISDYSCIVYEAAVRNVPLLFYNFDMDKYENGRGLAIDYYKELPGVISKDADEIADALNHLDAYDMDELKAFAHKYVYNTPHATKDIVDFVYSIGFR